MQAHPTVPAPPFGVNSAEALSRILPGQAIANCTQAGWSLPATNEAVEPSILPVDHLPAKELQSVISVTVEAEPRSESEALAQSYLIASLPPNIAAPAFAPHTEDKEDTSAPVTPTLPIAARAVLTVAVHTPRSISAESEIPTIALQSQAPAIAGSLGLLQFPTIDIKVPDATPRKRRRAKSMSRRRGQTGSIETSGNWMVVRYWIDIPGQEQRRHACKRICPKFGAGLLSKSQQRRRAKEIIAESGCDTEEYFEKVVLHQKVVTFREQAEWWLNWLQTRNHSPIPETSVPSLRSAIDKWLTPNLGDLPLSEVGNGALKRLVKKMAGNLSPKTQRTYIGYAKEIRESLVDGEGEQVHPITWNNDFIDLPPVVKREQRRGKLSAEEIEQLIADASEQWVHALYVLNASSGMRIAEILAIEIDTCLSPDCSMILVKQQVKGSRIVQYLKTDAAYRIVDLCPEAAEYLRAFVGERRGLLFPSQKGTTPVCYHNFCNRYLTPAMTKLGMKEPGKACHAFRRFRSSVLAKSGIEEDLRKFWLGHENDDITAAYAEQIREDNAWRQSMAARTGLGFKIPAFVPKPIVRNVRKNRGSAELVVGG